MKHPFDLPQDVGEKQHLQHQEGVGEALPQRRSPHHTSALVFNEKTECGVKSDSMKRGSAAACSISDNVMDDFFIGFSTAGKYDRLSPSLMQFHKYCVEYPALADIGAVPSAFCWRFSASEKGFSAPGSCKSHRQFTS